MNGFEVSLINDKIKYFKICEIFPLKQIEQRI